MKAVGAEDEQWVQPQGPDLRYLVNFWLERVFLDAVVVLCASCLWLALAIPWWRPLGHKWPAPGRLAILLTVAVFLLQVMRQCLWWWSGSEDDMRRLWFLAAGYGAMALIGGWSLLRAVGGWRASVDSADLPGRVLGWCWLVVMLAYWAASIAFN